MLSEENRRILRLSQDPHAYSLWLKRQQNKVCAFFNRPPMWPEVEGRAATTPAASLRTVAKVEAAPPPPDMKAAILAARRPWKQKVDEAHAQLLDGALAPDQVRRMNMAKATDVTKPMTADEAARIVEAKAKREREEAEAARVLAIKKDIEARERAAASAERQRKAELDEAVSMIEALEKAHAAVGGLDRAGLYRCTSGSASALVLADTVSAALEAAKQHLGFLREPETRPEPRAAVGL